MRTRTSLVHHTTTAMRFGFLHRLRTRTSRLALLAAPAAAAAHISTSPSTRLDAGDEGKVSQRIDDG